jgi:hypothetical protein
MYRFKREGLGAGTTRCGEDQCDRDQLSDHRGRSTPFDRQRPVVGMPWQKGYCVPVPVDG